MTAPTQTGGPRRPRPPREAYPHIRPMTTRWRDNDVYGHLNNVVYYEYVDSVVNGWLIAEGGLRIPDGPVIGLVVETACVYHESISYPEGLDAGLRVTRIGTSSVRYEVGLFRATGPLAAAEARFTHVYVDAATRRPVAIPDDLRRALGTLTRD